MSETIAKRIADLSIECFRNLGKAGKPADDEWTTLCSIVIEENGVLSVACLATGTKCVTGERAKIKNVIIDCHAECLCKRAFKRFLIDRIKHGKGVEDAKFHLFISQLPCGVIDRYKASDAKEPGYIGVRRKPGKGERCSKPSCVDKLCKWNILGLQGRRLMAITKKPIRCDTIVIGNCGEANEFNEINFKAALLVNQNKDENPTKKMKFDASDVFQVDVIPVLYFCKDFKHSLFTRSERLRASNSAIVFWKEKGANSVEIVVNGFKQGVTKKKLQSSTLRICKQLLTEDTNGLIEKLKGFDLELIDLYENQLQKLKSLPRFEGWT